MWTKEMSMLRDHFQFKLFLRRKITKDIIILGGRWTQGLRTRAAQGRIRDEMTSSEHFCLYFLLMRPLSKLNYYRIPCAVSWVPFANWYTLWTIWIMSRPLRRQIVTHFHNMKKNITNIAKMYDNGGKCVKTMLNGSCYNCCMFHIFLARLSSRQIISFGVFTF